MNIPYDFYLVKSVPVESFAEEPNLASLETVHTERVTITREIMEKAIKAETELQFSLGLFSGKTVVLVDADYFIKCQYREKTTSLIQIINDNIGKKIVSIEHMDFYLVRSLDMQRTGGVATILTTYKEESNALMTKSFEIQEFVKTNEPIKTIDYATGRKEADEKFRKALENHRGKAIRMIQVIIDFTSLEKKEVKK